MKSLGSRIRFPVVASESVGIFEEKIQMMMLVFGSLAIVV